MQQRIIVKIRPDYTCISCLRKEEGTDIYESDPLHSLDEAQEYIRGISQRPPVHGIPIGWASYGLGIIKCNKCSGE